MPEITLRQWVSYRQQGISTYLPVELALSYLITKSAFYCKYINCNRYKYINLKNKSEII